MKHKLSFKQYLKKIFYTIYVLVFKPNYQKANAGKAKPFDTKRINLYEMHEIKYWTKTFDVTKKQLKKAVSKVGVSAAAVKDELRKVK